MIDWFGILASATWIAGLAVLVTTLGWARMAREQSLWQTLSEHPYRLALIGGGVLFALGMALAVNTWYERAGWAIVTLLLVWDGTSVWRNQSAHRKD